MRRVLVTGASGFVGRHACEALRARGFEVHGVGRGSGETPHPVSRGSPLLEGEGQGEVRALSGEFVHLTPTLSFQEREQVALLPSEASGSIRYHAADLLNSDERRDLIAGVRPSHLLHLAWEAEPGRYWASEKNLDWVAASLDLARRFAACGGRRFVGAGTCAEYEWGSERFHETATPCRPATLYGAAKDGTRRILAAYAGTVNVSFAWGRLFYLYGPGEGDGRLVSGAIRALLAGKPFPTSAGHQTRDFLHVSDAAHALAALLDGPVEGPVNIGSGGAVPVRALLDGLGTLTGRPDLLAYGARTLGTDEPAVIEADAGRLAEEVDFRPRFTLAAGLADTLAWWRGHTGDG